MIKKYDQFITEKFSQGHFLMNYEDLLKFHEQILAKGIDPNIFSTVSALSSFKHPQIDSEEIKKLSRLKDRLNESRAEFLEKLTSLEDFYCVSFSSIVKDAEANPEKDFQEMQHLMDRAGFTLDIIKKLFDKTVCIYLGSQFSSFVRVNYLNDISGYMDIYLYMLNEKLDLDAKIWLGGDGWGDEFQLNPEVCYILRYSYGYHKTTYGKMFFENIGMTTDQFLAGAYEYLRDYFKENIYPRILDDLKKIAKTSSLSDFNFDSYLTLDDDRFIIHYGDMSKDFAKLTDYEYEDSINSEWFKQEILSNMRMFSDMDIQDTDSELIFND